MSLFWWNQQTDILGIIEMKYTFGMKDITHGEN